MENSAQTTSTTINGFTGHLQVDVGTRLRDAIRSQPLGRHWATTTDWVSGFKSTTSARGHTIATDETADFLADDSAPTAGEYVLSALGACLTAGMVMQTTVRQITLHQLRIHVAGRFDNVVHTGDELLSAAERGQFALHVTAEVAADAPDSVLHELWQSVVAASPVAHTLLRPTPLVASLTVHSAE